jgi:mono/diheme cytochrome c family protein
MMERVSRIAGPAVALAGVWAGLALVLSATPSVAADPAPKPEQGQILVQRWCVGCHLVGGEQTKATTDAPPFASIARRPDFDAARIAAFLLDPHPKMPNMALSRVEANDIAAYIASLKEASLKEAPPK